MNPQITSILVQTMLGDIPTVVKEVADQTMEPNPLNQWGMVGLIVTVFGTAMAAVGRFTSPLIVSIVNSRIGKIDAQTKLIDGLIAERESDKEWKHLMQKSINKIQRRQDTIALAIKSGCCQDLDLSEADTDSDDEFPTNKGR